MKYVERSFKDLYNISDNIQIISKQIEHFFFSYSKIVFQFYT